MGKGTGKGRDARIKFDVDSKRSDLKPLLEQLNPILKKILEAVEKSPDKTAEVGVENLPASFHKVSYCKFDD